MSADGFSVMNGYARSLLPTMLQGIKGIVNGFDYIIAGLIEGYTNNTAGIVQLCTSSSRPFSSIYDF
jgi:dihydrodipicolinate synthase/N-acetylneuraminate lyase